MGVETIIAVCMLLLYTSYNTLTFLDVFVYRLNVELYVLRLSWGLFFFMLGTLPLLFYCLLCFVYLTISDVDKL